VDQYNDAPKVKVKNAQKGDLVFFDNGSGVSHVGIVVSEKGSPLMMIHSSSSKGVIITDVTKSAYWTKRLKGFGTYVD
jgi:cell wall-associated NlpC family hydrolase